MSPSGGNVHYTAVMEEAPPEEEQDEAEGEEEEEEGETMQSTAAPLLDCRSAVRLVCVLLLLGVFCVPLWSPRAWPAWTAALMRTSWPPLTLPSLSPPSFLLPSPSSASSSVQLSELLMRWNSSATPDDCATWPVCEAGAGDPVGLTPSPPRLVEFSLPLSPSLLPLLRVFGLRALPFPGVNAVRLSRLYALLQAGVGVVVAVTGGSMSSGHQINESLAAPMGGQRQAIYGGQLVQWLNEAYPVRHPHVYRHLERHVMWNLARPATPSTYTSFCIEHQVMECVTRMQDCSMGGLPYIERRRREWANTTQHDDHARRQHTSLTIDACTLTTGMQGGGEVAAPPPHCVLTGLHMPDLLLFEFGINENRDHLESPDPQPVVEEGEEALHSMNATGGVEGGSDAAGDAAAAARAHAYLYPGPSLERFVRLVLHRADLPTASFVVHHSFAPIDHPFYSVQSRHAAVAEHYGLPAVSMRDALFWQPVLQRVYDDQEAWWTLLFKSLYHDAAHLSYHGHGVLATLIRQHLRLTRWQSHDPQAPPPALWTDQPTALPLPSISLAMLDAVINSTLTAQETSQLLPSALHPPSDVWASSSSYTCRRVLTDTTTTTGDWLVLQALNSSRGWMYDDRRGDKFFYRVDADLFAQEGEAQLDIQLARPVLSWFGLMIISSGASDTPMGWALAWLSCQHRLDDAWTTFNSPKVNLSGLYNVPFTTEQVKQVWRLEEKGEGKRRGGAAPCSFDRAHVRSGDGLLFMVSGYIASHAD